MTRLTCTLTPLHNVTLKHSHRHHDHLDTEKTPELKAYRLYVQPLSHHCNQSRKSEGHRGACRRFISLRKRLMAARSQVQRLDRGWKSHQVLFDPIIAAYLVQGAVDVLWVDHLHSHILQRTSHICKYHMSHNISYMTSYKTSYQGSFVHPIIDIRTGCNAAQSRATVEKLAALPTRAMTLHNMAHPRRSHESKAGRSCNEPDREDWSDPVSAACLRSLTFYWQELTSS